MAKQIKRFSKIALIIGLSITLMAMYLATPLAKSANLTDREVRITDSRLGATSVEYDFLATGQASDILCIKVTFCDEATIGGSCTAPDNMDTTGATTTNTSAWNNISSTYWAIELNATTANSVIASTTQGSEQLGSAGSFVIGGLTNSNATQTYFAWIQTYSDGSCSTPVDEGVVAFAILSGVTVSATVAETLTVKVNASSCDAFLTAGTNATSATTSITFGTISANGFYNSCQRMDIGTNAATGYNARIHKTQQLTSAGSDVIEDGDCDGACGTSTAAVWQTTVDSASGFGYCMKDRDQNGAQVADVNWIDKFCGSAVGDQYFKTISNAATGSETFMQSGSATTTNRAWIGYRLNVPGNQMAGTYTTVIIYTVTPKY